MDEKEVKNMISQIVEQLNVLTTHHIESETHRSDTFYPETYSIKSK